MTKIQVKTQQELDAALANRKPDDVIVCLGGTWNDPLVARDSSRVEAWGSSSVEARGSSSVVAWGSSSVEASKYVAIHKMPGHSGKIAGGVVIEVPDTSTMDGVEWCEYYGVEVRRRQALLFKAVDDDYSTVNARSVELFYTPGAKVVAPDFDPRRECGQGLHASPSPSMARQYNEGATRFVAVKAKVADLVVLGDKVKVPALTVAFECDRFGDPVATEAVAA